MEISIYVLDCDVPPAPRVHLHTHTPLSAVPFSHDPRVPVPYTKILYITIANSNRASPRPPKVPEGHRKLIADETAVRIRRADARSRQNNIFLVNQVHDFGCDDLQAVVVSSLECGNIEVVLGAGVVVGHNSGRASHLQNKTFGETLKRGHRGKRAGVGSWGHPDHGTNDKPGNFFWWVLACRAPRISLE